MGRVINVKRLFLESDNPSASMLRIETAARHFVRYKVQLSAKGGKVFLHSEGSNGCVDSPDATPNCVAPSEKTPTLGNRSKPRKSFIATRLIHHRKDNSERRTAFKGDGMAANLFRNSTRSEPKWDLRHIIF